MRRTPKRVAVIGAGSMGSQAMWRLAARGAEVIGYDRYAPGHDRGAYRPHLPRRAPR
jgi:sarcosine oxidase